MRRNIVRNIEMLLLAGLVMPVGMLFAVQTPQSFSLSSNNANWYDTEQATNLLHQMRRLSFKTRKDAARLQAQGLYLNWEDQATKLQRAKTDVNKLSADLAQLKQIKNRLEPWQQSLVNKVTPEVHEMVYQLNAAIKTLNHHQNKAALALTEYPKNINMIYKQANQTVSTIGTVTQYVHAEQKMASLERNTTTSNS